MFIALHLPYTNWLTHPQPWRKPKTRIRTPSLAVASTTFQSRWPDMAKTRSAIYFGVIGGCDPPCQVLGMARGQADEVGLDIWVRIGCVCELP